MLPRRNRYDGRPTAWDFEEFKNPLRKVFGNQPTIGKITVPEMLAYCAAWGIEPEGEILANQDEYRIGPHPRSYAPRLSSKPSKTLYLAGQTDAF